MNLCCSVGRLNCYSLHISLKSPRECQELLTWLTASCSGGQPLPGPAEVAQGYMLKCGLFSDSSNPVKVLSHLSEAKSVWRREGDCPVTFRDSCSVSCCGWFQPENSERNLKKAVLPGMTRGCGQRKPESALVTKWVTCSHVSLGVRWLHSSVVLSYFHDFAFLRCSSGATPDCLCPSF